MLTYKGKYAEAIVMTDSIDEGTVAQIFSMMNCPAMEGMKVRIMLDTHVGSGSVIGFTATMNDKIVPHIIGVDIGCSVEAHYLNVTEIDFAKLDRFIRRNVPAGFAHHKKPVISLSDTKKYFNAGEFLDLCEKLGLGSNDVLSQLGTLGGGNHFIEIDKHDNEYWLVIHTGSRNFGLQVANYHQKVAKEKLKEEFGGAEAYKGMEWLSGEDMENYIHDMQIAQNFASLNRRLISTTIIEDYFGHKFSQEGAITSTHNYINMKDRIIRKGAISADVGERLLIPLNMRDGVIVGLGKGNPDWNNSAPHGAGRLLSRSKAKKEIAMEDYQKSMDGIWTSSVNKNTLDESPMAYKDAKMVIDGLYPNVDIQFIMKPVYSFKSSGD